MSARQNQQLYDAIGRIHEAAVAPDTWPVALEAISHCFAGPKVVMFGVDLCNGTVQNLRTHDIERAACDAYAAYYHQLDPWFNAIDPAWKPLRALPGTQIVSDAVVRKTGFYNDFIKKLDMRFVLSGFPSKTSRWMDIFSLFNGVNQDDFDRESVDRYQILLEHVGQALELQRSIGHLNGLSKGLATALEHASQATLLLGANGTVLHANSKAVNTLYRADGITVKEGRLEASLPDAVAALGKLLKSAFEDLNKRLAFRRRIASIPRPSGRRPFLVRVFPIDQALDYVELADVSKDPQLVMTITDPDASSLTLHQDDLQAAYGLTPAEASLAAALARGDTLSEVAARKNVAVDSARKQLQSVFEKTGTHRQADLVQRLVVDLGLG